MQVHVHGQPAPWHEASLIAAVRSGHLHPETPVSLDQGRSWLPASLAAQRFESRGDDAVAFMIPVRTETWSTVAGYIALFSLLFFGGPFAFAAALVGFDPGPTITVRLGTVAAALVLGPLPPAAMALLGLRALRRDPTLRGKGRAIFALVCAGLMAAGCLVGLVGVVVAH
jgi:hypothetical protein